MAQQVVTTSGNFDESDSFSLSWTVGEPITETFSTGEFFLTQGFQQPWDIMPTQLVNITAGWSGISGYIDPADKNLDHIFSGHADHLDILSNFQGIYCPPENINTLANWEFTSGYQVKASQPFAISLKGSEHDGYSLALPSGWSVVPVLSACNQPVSQVFDAGSQVRIVKEVAGTGIYWPEYTINTIGELQTGKAYFTLLNEAATIVYPECAKSALVSPKVPILQNIAIWNNPVKTAQSHTVLIPGKMIAELKWEPGDAIGGFTPEGICAGMVQLESDRVNHGLTLFGDDPLTAEKDGFAENDQIILKRFDAGNHSENEIIIEFDPAFPHEGTFKVNGISALQNIAALINAEVTAGRLDFNIFPNPASENITVSWTERIISPLEMTIYNSFGQVFFKETRQANSSGIQSLDADISGFEQGTYVLQLKTGKKYGIKKLIVLP